MKTGDVSSRVTQPAAPARKKETEQATVGGDCQQGPRSQWARVSSKAL